MKYIFLLGLAILQLNAALARQRIADNNYPYPGKPCPYFELDSIRDFRLQKVTRDDFKGKWLLLDFWSKYCLSCIESFPGIDARQKKFNNDIQYLLLGKQEADHGIRKIYEKHKNNLHLQIPHAFDSLLAKKFEVTSFPSIIIVDPEGIVYAITSHVTDENIADLIAGRHPQLRRIQHEGEDQEVQYTLADLDLKHDGSLLFSSQLFTYKPSVKGAASQQLLPVNGYFETINSNVLQLFMLAYIGQDGVGRRDTLWGPPAFEMTDSSRFGQLLKRESYCYRITVPENMNNREAMMQVMQNDLKSYFGYEALIEERQVPCWKLKATEKARIALKTKGGTPTKQGRVDTGFILKNYPLKKILPLLLYLKQPVIDETGIEGNVDIELPFLLTRFDGIERSLNENGLFLEKGTLKRKVLVIRDKADKR